MPAPLAPPAATRRRAARAQNNLGAFHGAEVPFVFGDTFELSGGEVDLSEAMSQLWTNHASSGDPNRWQGPTAVRRRRRRRL